jgi:hypothetical protein
MALLDLISFFLFQILDKKSSSQINIHLSPSLPLRGCLYIYPPLMIRGDIYSCTQVQQHRNLKMNPTPNRGKRNMSPPEHEGMRQTSRREILVLLMLNFNLTKR